MSAPLLRVERLKTYFPVLRGLFRKKVGDVRAVDDISFDILPGETLGLVGESGCGKTTVGRTILQLERATDGKVLFEGRDLNTLTPAELRAARSDFQIVFQDPYSSLNPRMTVGATLREAVELHTPSRGEEADDEVGALLERVGLQRSYAARYPHEFSGGQRQRIGIARALASSPKFIVCDESVSALDVSIQAQVLNLLADIQRERGIAYLFIAHDLSVVRHISDRVAVMYLGRIVELAPTDALFAAAEHPYTRALLSAIPVPNPRAVRQRILLQGDVPSPLNPPSGCAFHPRCPYATDLCRRERPALETRHPGHEVACHYALAELREAGLEAPKITSTRG